ncbi:Histone chaperone domain CHZ [Abeliophyllum distichum]|uniref:Histone chaperone domain CHZ n=1 Tax=Abeliophyllum distichum TaxID=126358 RepID=A0ABD1VQR5_9LAMI
MADDIVQEGEEKQEIQAKIEVAVRSRLQHFKDQANSLTLESVRRLLEKDLGLEKHVLDVHKRFIRQYLEKQMEDADDDNSKRTVENMEKDAHLSEKDVRESPKEHKTEKDPKEASNGDVETLEDSPVMGLLNSKSEVDNQSSVISESRIKKAIWDRADHFMANSEKITLAGVRRLLEEDLGLDKNTLDPFKKLISEQIDQVLNSNRVSKNANLVKKKSSENSQNKTSEKISSETGFDSSDGESDKVKDRVKSRNQAAPRAKDKKSDGLKKRKRSTKDSDSNVSGKNQSMRAKRPKEEDIDSDNDGSVSEEGQSQSSVGKPAKRKEQSTPGYGKQADHLRTIIKSCGMSVAPSVYKKVKQVPDNKREAFLVKELEGILKREGLSSNPTDKEIKDCRKRKERAKELEGIDMSNIISSSRRRSRSSYMVPKSKIETEGDKDDVKASKHKYNKDKDGNDGDEQEEKVEDEKVEVEDEKVEEQDEDDEGDDEEDEEEEGDDSQSEEFNEDNDEESD